MPTIADRSALLDPRQYRSWTQRGLAVLAVVGLLAGIGFAVFGQQIQQDRWDATPVCSDAVTSDCLTRQEGHVETRRVSGESTYYFEAEDGDRTKLGTSSSLRRQVDAGLYDGDDLVALEDFEGDRRYVGGFLATAGWFLLGSVGGVLVAAASMFFLRRSLR